MSGPTRVIPAHAGAARAIWMRCLRDNPARLNYPKTYRAAVAHMETNRINYDNRRFVSLNNTDNGDVGSSTVFHYRHEGDVVWATYRGGSVVFGSLIARVDDSGRLDMRYQHLNSGGEL